MPKKRNLPKGRKATNEHQKAKYKAHYFKTPLNKIRKVNKHLRKHTKDSQAKKSI